MSSCLVQQLFRQKIGQELDQGLVDAVIFPMLRQQKHASRELLLDIKLTHSSDEHGQSAIIMPRHLTTTQGVDRFTQIGCPRPRPLPPPGKTTSKFRRKMMSGSVWGSIEILNELRELNHPHIGYHISQGEDWVIGEDVPSVNEELENMFIRLGEGPEVWASEMLTAKHKEREKGLVNDFLEGSLVSDNGLSWGGDPENLFEPVLSTHY
jgi:hypothetical protein